MRATQLGPSTRAPSTRASLAIATLAALALGVLGCTTRGEEGSCAPISCDDIGAGCGIISDRCGGNLFCGRCDAPAVCDPLTNACACTPEGDPCLGKCGKVLDSCGKPMDCGGCAAGETCGAGGANVCGMGSCSPASCDGMMKNCGQAADGCGDLLSCGSCTGPQSCGGGGTANVCGCKPITCDELGKDCGSIDDTCGGMLDCGTCAGDKTCGGGGVANVCGSPSASGHAQLSWDPPTLYTDGSTLPPSGIAGYRVYFGIAPRAYGPPIEVGNVVSHSVAGLSSGATYYFAVTAVGIDGTESEYSAEASTTLP